MLPFRVDFQSGVAASEEVVYSVKKAVVTGRLRPGDRFPSVRALAKELKLNPNTAHKAVSRLVDEGVLEVEPGIGTVVARVPAATAREKGELLGQQLEWLVVEAKALSLGLEEVAQALAEHWRRLSTGKNKGAETESGRKGG